MKAGVRLAGGQWRGRRVQAVSGVRPTEGRVREALASIWLPRLEGARVLDLFAGSGAVGLELMSRGAGAVVLVDRNPKVIEALRRSVGELGARGVRVQRLDLPKGIGKLSGSFDLIFADPPYAFTDDASLLAGARPLAAPGATLAIEHSAKRDLEIVSPPKPGRDGSGWRLEDQRRYGDCCLSLFELAEP